MQKYEIRKVVHKNFKESESFPLSDDRPFGQYGVYERKYINNTDEYLIEWHKDFDYLYQAQDYITLQRIKYVCKHFHFGIFYIDIYSLGWSKFKLTVTLQWGW
jgi:hypothetical protein